MREAAAIEAEEEEATAVGLLPGKVPVEEEGPVPGPGPSAPRGGL